MFQSKSTSFMTKRKKRMVYNRRLITEVTLIWPQNELQCVCAQLVWFSLFTCRDSALCPQAALTLSPFQLKWAESCSCLDEVRKCVTAEWHEDRRLNWSSHWDVMGREPHVICSVWASLDHTLTPDTYQHGAGEKRETQVLLLVSEAAVCACSFFKKVNSNSPVYGASDDTDQSGNLSQYKKWHMKLKHTRCLRNITIN